MDLMLPYELADIIDNIPYTDRNSWELTRIVSYFIALKMCKKLLKVTEILPLPFDKNSDKEQDLDRLMIEKNAKMLEDILNKK